MTSKSLRILLLTGAVIIVGACNKTESTNGNNTAAAETKNSATASAGDPIASAESAAPAAIAHDASIMTVDAKGTPTTLRKGTNGWTCMPDAPDTPGPDPMCFDANAGKWVAAWVAHKPPPEGSVGLMYMLEGGTDASNTDPYAKQPTASNDWVKTGPHIMVVGSKDILTGHPSGAKPDTAVPYVMWAGTPYAHLMVPVTPAT
jgi:hypothetical protein